MVSCICVFLVVRFVALIAGADGRASLTCLMQLFDFKTTVLDCNTFYFGGDFGTLGLHFGGFGLPWAPFW